MSFASEPGRDDGNLPPVNVVIPDDARELDRDVLAYHREVRARRRRQRLMRFLRPFRLTDFSGHAAIVPMIAACLAICLVGGALLSVVTMSPAAAPTVSSQPQAAQSGVSPADLTELPLGSVQVSGRAVPVRSLVTSAIALVPANCNCSTELGRLAGQAVAAHVGVYFAGAGAVISQLPALVDLYGHGAAVAAADYDNVLTLAYHPTALTVLLVFKDARAEVIRNPSASFQLAPTLDELKLPGASLGTD